MSGWLILTVTGTLITTISLPMQRRLQSRHRTASAPGRWQLPVFRSRRDWFTTERAYRLHERAGWVTFVGGLMSLVGGVMLYRS
jgi:hypothetical protein